MAIYKMTSFNRMRFEAMNGGSGIMHMQFTCKCMLHSSLMIEVLTDRIFVNLCHLVAHRWGEILPTCCVTVPILRHSFHVMTSHIVSSLDSTFYKLM